METLELLPSRVETSYVSISQLNIGLQGALLSGAQVMSQSNAAIVFAPKISFFTVES